MLQLKKRADSKKGIRFMSTICFYQKTSHEKYLKWIKHILGVGYLSQRNDGMTELRINGYGSTYTILQLLVPYLRFKKVQAEVLLSSCALLNTKKHLSENDLKFLVSNMLEIQRQNYSTRYKRSKSELYQILGLTP